MIGWSGLWQAGWVDLDRSALDYLLPATRVLFHTFSAQTITRAAANSCMRLRVRMFELLPQACCGPLVSTRSAAIGVSRCEHPGELDSKPIRTLEVLRSEFLEDIDWESGFLWQVIFVRPKAVRPITLDVVDGH